MKYQIGCSGWLYNDWKGLFYPEDLDKAKWLEYYSSQFNSVEINNTFYKFPKKELFQDWYNKVPKDFTFTLKGSRVVTHLKKLNDPGNQVKNFFEQAEVLKDKIGAILWQLPGNIHKKSNRLENFCKILSSDFKNAIEFRHESWFDDEIVEILNKYKVAFCVISAPQLPETFYKTANFIYLRFHGKKDWYKHNYSKEELKSWKKKLEENKTYNAFLYFNNDYKANAPKNAKELSYLVNK